MSQEELFEYISRALAAGSNEEEIRASLKIAGWDDATINATIASAKTTAPTPTTPQPPHPQVNPATATQAEPIEPSDQVLKVEPLKPESSPLPISPTQNLETQTRTHILKMGASLALFLVIGGGIAYAYTKNIWPFNQSTYKEDAVIASLFSNIGSINSAAYGVTVSFVSEARDANAKAFSTALPEYDQEAEKYERDADRFYFLQEALSELNLEYDTLGDRYPTTLANTGVSETDPISKRPYGYRATNNAQNFELSITFETPEAIETIKKGRPYGAYTVPTIQGQTVIFDSTSQPYYYFKETPQLPAIIELFSSLEDDAFFEFIPGSINVSLKASGVIQEQNKETLDTKFQFGADFNLDDFLMSFDVELVKKSAIYYARINKFPGLFFVDFSKVKQKWIEIRPEDIGGGMGDISSITSLMTEDFFTGSNATAPQETQHKLLEEFGWLMTRLEEEKIITADRQPDDATARSLHKYKIVLHKDRIASSYRKIVDEAKTVFGDDALIRPDDTTLRYIENGNLDSIFDYISQNTDMFVWMNPKTGFPEKFEYSFRFVPSEKVRTMQDKQFRFTTIVSLEDINTPITIDAPKEFITVEDATIAMSGITKEEYRFNKQSGSVQSIRTALEHYKSITGSYPSVLSDLTKTRNDVKPSTPSTQGKPQVGDYQPYSASTPFLKVVPIDAISQKPFSYSRKGNDYTLVYSIELPPYEKGSQLSYNVLERTYLTQSSSSYTSAQTFQLKFINGNNTATSKALSVEAAAQAKIDADKDNVADSLEQYIGTNVQKRDTDGDGTNDGAELQKNSDPLGSGYLDYPDYGTGFLF